MSAVEIVCVSAAALALVLAGALVLSTRANRCRTADLRAALTALEVQVGAAAHARPQPADAVVHVLEPLEPGVDEQGRAIAVPTTAQVVDATLGRPLLRAVTLGHGLRRAMRPESRDRIAGLVRREFRRRRRLRMRTGRRAARLAVVSQVVDRPEEQERAS